MGTASLLFENALIWLYCRLRYRTRQLFARPVNSFLFCLRRRIAYPSRRYPRFAADWRVNRLGQRWVITLLPTRA